MFIDELFDNDVMWLHELRRALDDSGVMLEALVLDACMMANLETAWAVHDSARWMIASEEITPGEGTDVGSWLQALFCNPGMNGKQLGREICDKTQTWYASQGNLQAHSILAWSVIDLTAVERVVRAVEEYFREVCEDYRTAPGILSLHAWGISRAEEYGDGKQDMRDLAGIFETMAASEYMELDVRNEVLDAVSDAVKCCVRGSSRSRARGMSIWCPGSFTAEEMDNYAKICPMPSYLAYLDATQDWDAPEELYETVERLPDIRTIPEFQLAVKRVMTSSGLPGVSIVSGSDNLSGVYFRLYRLNEDTGMPERLGRSVCWIETEDPYAPPESRVWYADELWKWPAVEGELCDMELFLEEYDQEKNVNERVYLVPISLDTNVCNLRCVRREDRGSGRTYYVTGVWEAHSEGSAGMSNRALKELSSISGQEFHVLLPIGNERAGRRTDYAEGKAQTMKRRLEMEEQTLPPGTYYLEYEVDDMFGNASLLEKTEISWDGQSASLAEGSEWADETLLE